MRRLALAFAVLLAAAPALAVQPDEMLADPVLEARARAISKDIRCLVCQNQSIDDSEADLAHDLRVIVRERLVAGDTDQEVRDFLVARYGDFVLLDPPMKPKTYLLWFGPLVAFLLGAAAIWAYLRRRRAAGGPPAPLSAEEQERLAAVLGGGPDDRARPS
jgi:cytochrome c-type biogenesis protein CcmH